MAKNANTTVVTDKADYAPGAWAEITASGFTVGSTVMFKVDHVSGPGPDGVYGTVDDRMMQLGGDGHGWWKVTDGGEGDLDGVANGVIVTSWYVNPDDSLNQTFRLTAKGMYGETARTSFTDSLPGAADVNLTKANTTGEANGALFSNVIYSAGTGVIDPFVRLQANGSERGYNSGATSSNPNPQFNETGKYNSTYNHALALKDVPIAYAYNEKTGQVEAYYQFLLDINENSNAQGQQYLSLDTLKIYQSNSGTLSNYNVTNGTFNSPSTLAFDLDGGGTNRWIALNYDLNAGSGVGDMSVYVPVSNFNGSTYVYLYSEFGQQASSTGYLWETSAGFEEWSVGKLAPRSVSTITGSKFNDANGNGIKDAGEGVIAGVQVYFDQNQNGTLDWVDKDGDKAWDAGEGERWTTTDASGNYSFTNVAAGLGVNSTYYVREVVPTGYTQTGPKNGNYTVGVGSETATVTNNSVIKVEVKTADVTYTLPAFGNKLNFVAAPAMQITKSYVVDGDGIVNKAGDVITYTVVVKNTGNVTLTNVEVTDAFEGGSGQTIATGQTIGVGEQKTYTYTHTVSQAELDSNGGNDGKLTNVATADSAQTDPTSDTKEVPVVLTPNFLINKTATLYQSNGTTLDGDQKADAAGEIIKYVITLKNTGNVSLTSVTLADPYADAGSITRTAAGNGDNVLNVGETWTYTATHTVTQAELDSNGGGDGKLDNVATGDTAQTDPKSAAASIDIYKVPTGGLIAPTATTIQQYINGTYQTFQDYYASQGGVVQYGVKGGKISQTNPGVFFYFTGASGAIKGVDVDGKAGIDPISIKVDQYDPGPTKPFLPTFQSIVLYKVNDANNNGKVDFGETATVVKLSSSQVTIVSDKNSADYGDVFVDFTPDAVGSIYLLSVKYSTATVVGDSASGLPSVTYTFGTQLKTSTGEYGPSLENGSIGLKAKGSPLMLDGDAGDGAHAIKDAQMSHVLEQAMAYWSGQGLSEQQMALLKSATVDIANLGGKVLGYTEDGHITIDDDAAGHGWSLGIGGVAPNKVDLLSVLVHEMGHVLGHTDEEMGGTLAVGARTVTAVNDDDHETVPHDDDGDDHGDDHPDMPPAATVLGVVGTETQHPETHFG